jgi:hypothetical protein
MAFILQATAELVEPIAANILQMIKDHSAEVLAMAAVNKGGALPDFAEKLEVKKFKPHYPFCVVQAGRGGLAFQNMAPVQAVDEDHTITIFIGNQGSDENLVVRQMYRYLRAIILMIQSAPRNGVDLFAGMDKLKRAGMRVTVTAVNYGQLVYDPQGAPAAYSFLSSVTVTAAVSEA